MSEERLTWDKYVQELKKLNQQREDLAIGFALSSCDSYSQAQQDADLAFQPEYEALQKRLSI